MLEPAAVLLGAELPICGTWTGGGNLDPDSGSDVPLLAASSVIVKYGTLTAVHSASFAVKAREVVSLLGANGSGKTTLLRAATGIIPISAGLLQCQGENAAAWLPARFVRSGVIHVPEGRHLFPEMTVLENLRLGALAKPGGANVRLERVFALFPKLAERRSQEAGTLSGGEQQMLAIGRGLMGDPVLLILDEPSLGLAPIVVESILETLAQLRREGMSMLVVEQDVHVAVSVADRCYLMETGRIVLEGDPASFLENEKVRHSYLGLSDS